MPARAYRTLGRLIRIGRDPAMAPSEARYVVLSNIVAMLGVAFTLGVRADPGARRARGCTRRCRSPTRSCYLPTLWLNHARPPHRGDHVAAARQPPASSSSQVLVEGTGFDVHLFFMLHADAAVPAVRAAPQPADVRAVGARRRSTWSLVVAFGDRLPQLGPAIARERLAIAAADPARRPVRDARGVRATTRAARR